MAGEVDILFPAFEVLGGTLPDVGRSGSSLKFPPFTATGGSYGHFSVGVAVPMQTTTFQVSRGSSFSGALTVPRVQGDSRFGMQFDLTVPLQTLAVSGTFPGWGEAALTVPLQVVYGHGLIGDGYGAALRVPVQTLSTRMGGRGAVVVPVQYLTAQVTAMEYARAGLVAPIQQVLGSLVVSSLPWRAALRVPLLIPGPYGRSALVVPMQAVTGNFALPGLPGEFEAWVMNVRNGGVTRWTNFPFTGFTRLGNKTFAVGQDGNLYLLGGDTDAGEPIQWEFETGIDDLGNPAKKHMPYLYLGGIIDGVVEIAVIDDLNRVFAYEYDTKDRGAVHLTHRRKIGNGIRTVNVGYRLRSTKGAYIELDWLGPEITNTERNV